MYLCLGTLLTISQCVVWTLPLAQRLFHMAWWQQMWMQRLSDSTWMNVWWTLESIWYWWITTAEKIWSWLWCMRSCRSCFIIYSKDTQKQKGCRTGILSTSICTYCICESKILYLGKWIDKGFAVWNSHAREHEREEGKFLCSSLSEHGYPAAVPEILVMPVFRWSLMGWRMTKGQWEPAWLPPCLAAQSTCATPSANIINYCLPQK